MGRAVHWVIPNTMHSFLLDILQENIRMQSTLSFIDDEFCEIKYVNTNYSHPDIKM